MTKSSTASSRSRSGTFPSPGTPPPSYRHRRHCAASTSTGYPKGWSSERVPLSAAGQNRRCGGSGVVLPFNNGRKLPYKWEDAEKWILSPTGDAPLSTPQQLHHHRRPKSKSGPLGHPSTAAPELYALPSPFAPCFDGILAGNIAVNSPPLAGVLMAAARRSNANADGNPSAVLDRGRKSGAAADGGLAGLFSAHNERCIVRSASIHGWSDALIEQASSSAEISRAPTPTEAAVAPDLEESEDLARNEISMVSCEIATRDACTQMSSSGSSSKGSSLVPKEQPLEEQLSSHVLSKLEVRDVQVDDQVTLTRWSRRHSSRGSDNKRSAAIAEWKRKILEPRAPSFNENEREQCILKCKSEEAKITAWENLQKAKAEAAIRKLEMKIEKKRSSSMDRILKQLQAAQKRAKDLRAEASANADQCATGAAKRCSVGGTRRTGVFSRCFSCVGG